VSDFALFSISPRIHTYIHRSEKTKRQKYSSAVGLIAQSFPYASNKYICIHGMRNKEMRMYSIHLFLPGNFR
jgi:hypothetical protein